MEVETKGSNNFKHYMVAETILQLTLDGQKEQSEASTSGDQLNKLGSLFLIGAQQEASSSDVEAEQKTKKNQSPNK